MAAIQYNTNVKQASDHEVIWRNL